MHPLLALRLTAWRSRRVLRALLVALLVAVAVRWAAPPGPPTAAVIVAARPVPTGHTLTAEDLRTVQLPSAAVPSTSPSTREAVLGRRAAIDLPAGLVLVPAVLDAGRFPVDPPSGTVVVPVTLGGSAALRVGDTVEVVADQSCRQDGEPLVVTALVVGRGTAPGSSSGSSDAVTGGGLGAGLGLGSTTQSWASEDSTTLIAVAPQSGRDIAEIVTDCRLNGLIVP